MVFKVYYGDFEKPPRYFRTSRDFHATTQKIGPCQMWGYCPRYCPPLENAKSILSGTIFSLQIRMERPVGILKETKRL